MEERTKKILTRNVEELEEIEICPIDKQHRCRLISESYRENKWEKGQIFDIKYFTGCSMLGKPLYTLNNKKGYICGELLADVIVELDDKLFKI